MSKAAIAEKEKFVDAFAEELKAAKAILVINYLGLTVEEVTNMRKAKTKAQVDALCVLRILNT